jgi:hypothetical protein
MRRRLAFVPFVLLFTLLIACGGDDGSSAPTIPPGPTATIAPTVEPTPAPSPTPVVVRQDIRPSRLAIPSLGIDQPVVLSQVVPYVYIPEPGCPPAPPEDDTTLTVPNQGIATPEEPLAGLENKAWIFGHSRWLGAPGVLFPIQDLNVGDELFIDGIDRTTGASVTGKRYVVDGLYLSDVDSGDTWLSSDDPSEIPAAPQLVLQTSVRERGAGRAWILDRGKLTAKAQNIVDGDVDDPCRYLLLFVLATASPG